uniref:Reverse transcriptase/retrotransposon-derived protein RNase H-like domain-containing protein n=1 Tax=Trichuris muris TaxID=70415 RepID=A0A5S6QGQ2_TRIMR
MEQILAAGCNYVKRLHMELQRLRKAGLPQNEDIHMTEERMEAIQQMPTPVNVHELRSFLGAIDYCAKFVPGFQRLECRCTNLQKAVYSLPGGERIGILVEHFKSN